MMNLKTTALFILIALFYDLMAQQSMAPDTATLKIIPEGIAFFCHDFEMKGPDFLLTEDSSFNDIHRYDPVFTRNGYFANLGNQGLAHTNLVYNPLTANGFKTGINAFNQYLFMNDSAKYYLVQKPYTRLNYVMGPKNEQNLGILHTQNVASWFNVGLQFRTVSSKGLYRNQKGDNKNFLITTRFQTRNFRYMVLANYMHNKLKMQENGGIQNDSVFEENIISSRDGIAVHLNTARNYMKENSFFVKQLFNLSRKSSLLKRDTSGYENNQSHKRPGVVAYSFHYAKTTYLYEQDLQDNNGFYQSTFDSVYPTFDSTQVFKVENQLSWTNSDPWRDHWFSANIKFRHQYIEYSVDTTRNIYNLLIPTTEFRLRFSDVIHLQLFGDYVIGDEYSGDYTISGNLKLNSRIGQFSYLLKNSGQELPRLFHSYHSNHFVWDYDMRKQYFFIHRVSFKKESFQVGIQSNSIENFAYFNENALPVQLEENLNIFQGQVSKVFLLGNFTFDLQLIYQKASQSQSIRHPEWIADLSVFYTKPLFRGATTIQTGFDLFYYSSYYAYGYMPATRSFFVQNEKMIGDYFYADVFLNLKIKRTFLFLKYSNLGFLFNEFRYYTVPSYPMKDGGFRFGLSWAFYD
jgi:hypothetical protein